MGRTQGGRTSSRLSLELTGGLVGRWDPARRRRLPGPFGRALTIRCSGEQYGGCPMWTGCLSPMLGEMTESMNAVRPSATHRGLRAGFDARGVVVRRVALSRGAVPSRERAVRTSEWGEVADRWSVEWIEMLQLMR